MGLFSRTQIYAFREFILSPQLENIMLFWYIVCFIWIIVLKKSTMNGSGLRADLNSDITAYRFHEDLKEYFHKHEFEQIETVDDLYNYFINIQNKKLWPPQGNRAPNWPIGSTRIVQARVKVKKECGSAALGDNSAIDICSSSIPEGLGDDAREELLFDCYERIYSYECNPMFSEKDTEYGYVPTPENGKQVSPVPVDPDIYKIFERPENNDCATHNCSEYIYNPKTSTNGFSGKYGSYPARGYTIDFNDDRMLNIQKIRKLITNNWIDQDTRAIQINWAIKSAWSQTYYTFQANMELPGNGQISEKQLNQQNLFFYEDKKTGVNTNIYQFEIILHLILLIHSSLYLAKILFELSLSVSRVTNFLELFNLAMMFTTIFTKFFEVAIKSNSEFDMTDTNTFVDFSFLISIEQLNTISLAACSFFFPFRCFQWLAHFKFFEPAKVIINTYSRTTPGLALMLFMAFTAFLSWSIGIVLMLGNQYPEMSTYGNCLYTITSMSVADIKSLHQIYTGEMDMTMGAIDGLHLVLFLCTMIMYLFGIAIMTNLYRLAMNFEDGHCVQAPEKLAFRGKIKETGEKLEELIKMSMNQTSLNDYEFKNQKIVAWLLNRNKEAQSNERQLFFQRMNQELQDDAREVSTHINETAGALSPFHETTTDARPTFFEQRSHLEQQKSVADSQLNNSYSKVAPTERSKVVKDKESRSSKGYHIQPIEFVTSFHLQQFLMSLFQLKPVLKTSVTYDKFRIVIEFYTAGMGDKRFDISIIEEVIDYLREVGCKVPVLIYSDFVLSTQLYQKVMQLKKKYLMLFFTNSINEVKRYCKMELIREKY